MLQTAYSNSFLEHINVPKTTKPVGRGIKSQQTIIIEKYITTIEEYFHLINESSILKDNAHILFVGLNAIQRVFEYVLIKTQSVEKAYYYSQRSYYYYLEYMEQIYQSNLSQNLNHTDAMFFVYKKTIIEMHDGEQNASSNTMSNIMTLNEQNQIIDEKAGQELFLQLNKMLNTLFFWGNHGITCEDRLTLCNNYLLFYLLNVKYTYPLNAYIDILHQRISNMEFDKYNEIMKELLNGIKTKKNYDIDSTEYGLLKFYIDEDTMYERYKDCTAKEFAKWIKTSVST